MKTARETQHLTTLIEEAISDLDIPDEPSALYEPVQYTLANGGKRLRPYLALLACGLCGGRVDEAVPVGLAVELLHNFTLVHDDIMDSADTRRGEPSVFKKWDVSTAILSGDVLFVKAQEQLQYYGDSQDYSKYQYSELNRLFLKATRTVCEGQAYDLDFESRTKISLDEYLQMISKKTASLLSISMRMGGIVAGVNRKKLELLDQIGLQVGMAFQIQDDLLDVVGDPDKFGKKVGGDIATGKKTYLTVLALEKFTGDAYRKLSQILQTKKVSPEQINYVIQILENKNITTEASIAARDRYNEAIALTEKFEDNSYKNELVQLLKNLKKREH